VKEALRELEPSHITVFPTADYLKSFVDTSEYVGRPFSLRLALGESEITPVYFNPTVLERYRNDPRYEVFFNGYSGQIACRPHAGDGADLLERDQAWLKAIGLAYDESDTRAIVVFLIYLSDLSPEHQQHWNGEILEGSFRPHLGFVHVHIRGQSPSHYSVYEAILREIETINELCVSLSRPPLFLTSYAMNSIPSEFSFLIRPTRKEYDQFIHNLDKLLSDNINKKFFKSEIELTEDRPRNDGKVEVIHKNTIRLLSEWLHKNFRTDPPELMDRVMNTFIKVREARQRPAHKIDQNEHQQEYFAKQKELVTEVYEALAHLRRALYTLPGAVAVDIDHSLLEGKIWDV